MSTQERAAKVIALWRDSAAIYAAKALADEGLLVSDTSASADVTERARLWLQMHGLNYPDTAPASLADLLQTYGDERERTALEEAQRADDAYEEALMNMHLENSPADTAHHASQEKPEPLPETMAGEVGTGVGTASLPPGSRDVEMAPKDGLAERLAKIDWKKLADNAPDEPGGIIAGDPNGPMGDIVKAELIRQLSQRVEELEQALTTARAEGVKQTLNLLKAKAAKYNGDETGRFTFLNRIADDIAAAIRERG